MNSIMHREPLNFHLEKTSVWSFKERGDWLTHNGNYRGNWSPYIPRNVILRYTKEGDIVLDQFCGSGTTLIEAKSLKRHSIGSDINPRAIELAKGSVDFNINTDYHPKINLCDARDLKKIKDTSIDLICTHPPYADIIKYSESNIDDISHKGLEDFLSEMILVARECFRVLKSNKYCAILIGDMRKEKHVIPLGFRLMNIFIDSGLILKEIVIKEQHNCRSTSFWEDKSKLSNFLLLAHEYLFIFRKP